MAFDYGKKRPDGQYENHPTLPVADEGDLPFPVRTSYKHLSCGTITSMPRTIARTYAKEPGFYSSTFCAACGDYYPVGEDGEFVWVENGYAIEQKVGTVPDEEGE